RSRATTTTSLRSFGRFRRLMRSTAVGLAAIPARSIRSKRSATRIPELCSKRTRVAGHNRRRGAIVKAQRLSGVHLRALLMLVIHTGPFLALAIGVHVWMKRKVTLTEGSSRGGSDPRARTVSIRYLAAREPRMSLVPSALPEACASERHRLVSWRPYPEAH